MAADLRSTLVGIHEKYGKLTPRLVVDEARDPNHPLHTDLFGRPDGELADLWRLERARELIRSVRITYRKGDDKREEGSVRAWHVTRREETGESTYAPTPEILGNEFQRRLLIADMEREWRTFEARYQHLLEFDALIRGESPDDRRKGQAG